MPTFDVTFRVQYQHTLRIDAVDEDFACDIVGDAVREDIPGLARRVDIQLYGCEVATGIDE